MSTEAKTRRRDGDPVRVYADGRIWYWTGGRPGVGQRVAERHGTPAEAEARAAELRTRLAPTRGLGPEAACFLHQAMQTMVKEMREAGDPEGSVRQYKSNWNTWIPSDVGSKVRCLDADIRHWKAIFDSANSRGATEPTVKNIARTLGVLIEWGINSGYFPSSEAFGDPVRRRTIVKKARKRARIVKAESENRYPRARCPKVADVENYAAAFEEVYPGYGERLVLTAFGTGLRINELLALRHDSINLETGEVYVDWQLDRYHPWPARRLPKGGGARIAVLWTCYTDVAASLIEDSLALDHDDEHYGWLLPRHRSTKGWAEQAGKLAGEAKLACDWDWTFHWLRHAFATCSMASEKSGGYMLDPVSVQEC